MKTVKKIHNIEYLSHKYIYIYIKYRYKLFSLRLYV